MSQVQTLWRAATALPVVEAAMGALAEVSIAPDQP